MSEERLQEIKDSVDLQLELCKRLKVSNEMILEEKELYDYTKQLKEENKQLKEKIEKAQKLIEVPTYPENIYLGFCYLFGKYDYDELPCKIKEALK